MPQQQHPFAPRKNSAEVADPNNRPLVVDGSPWLHAPKALLWLLTEATLIALSCYDHYVSKLLTGILSPDARCSTSSSKPVTARCMTVATARQANNAELQCFNIAVS